MSLLPNDAELVLRLKKGDVKAFDDLFKNYSGRVYAFALRYLKSTYEAEELVQIVFLKVWENRHSLKKELSFKSYIFTITYNDICKIFRRRNYVTKFVADTLYEDSDVSFDAEVGIDYRSLLERVQKIIDSLSERQKEIFLKSREEGKTTKEIAEELNLSPGTVDNYISQTIKYIKNRLYKEGIAIVILCCTCLIC